MHVHEFLDPVKKILLEFLPTYNGLHNFILYLILCHLLLSNTNCSYKSKKWVPLGEKFI